MEDLISRTKLLEDFQKTITENSGTFDWLNMINRQPNISLENHDKEIRDKVLKKFAEKMKDVAYQWFANGTMALGMIDEIAEQMKATTPELLEVE